MNKKIKVIELLNEMANNENYHPKVKYQEMTYIYHNDIGDYTNDFNSEYGIFSGWALNLMLNYEVEILEDNTEEIEELDNWFVDERKECREFDIQAINLCFSKHRDKINELVKVINSIRKDKSK